MLTQERTSSIQEFLAAHFGADPGSVRVQVSPLRGGLENAGVLRVRAQYSASRRTRRISFISKTVPPEGEREITAYEALLPSQPSVAPRLLGIGRNPGGETTLYLEWIHSRRSWPWRDVGVSALALEKLSAAHTFLSDKWFHHPHILASWNYDAELKESAETTIEMLGAAAGRTPLVFRRTLPALRRLTAQLPRLRLQLMNWDLRTAVLHGDVHSGNVLVRHRSGAPEPLLIDWGRTRIGSPLEDVSSWLQSLGYWEPQAKRKHDSLLKHYLVTRGFRPVLSATLREAYWIAAACNGLAGALRYHCACILDAHRRGPARASAENAAMDWLRILRRADSVSRR